MNDLSRKNVLILGGSRGIGAAIVRRLSAARGRIAFTYHGSPEAASALAAATGAEAVRADSANRAELAAAVSARGAIDILVVNAGIGVTGDPITLDPDRVDQMIDINLRAPYFAAVEAARLMPSGGRIILIGSSVADRAPFPGCAAYAMTKAGLQGIARGLARDLGARNITVNVVQPGPVDTEMNPAHGPASGIMHSLMAIQRHAATDEIAALVAYLASDDAAMITGATLNIDGGFCA